MDHENLAKPLTLTLYRWPVEEKCSLCTIDYKSYLLCYISFSQSFGYRLKISFRFSRSWVVPFLQYECKCALTALGAQESHKIRVDNCSCAELKFHRPGCLHCELFPLHKVAHVGVSQHTSLKLLGREIIFEEFQPMWARYRYLKCVTDRRYTVLWQYRAVHLASRRKKEIIISWNRIHDWHVGLHIRGRMQNTVVS